MNTATDTPQTHLEPTGREPRPCGTCRTVFTPKRAWATFCSTRCRNAHHQAERRKEVMREAAPELYEALLAARAAIRGRDQEHIWTNYPAKPEVTLGQVIDAALAKAGYREPKPEKPKAEAPA